MKTALVCFFAWLVAGLAVGWAFLDRGDAGLQAAHDAVGKAEERAQQAEQAYDSARLAWADSAGRVRVDTVQITRIVRLKARADSVSKQLGESVDSVVPRETFDSMDVAHRRTIAAQAVRIDTLERRIGWLDSRLIVQADSMRDAFEAVEDTYKLLIHTQDQALRKAGFRIKMGRIGWPVAFGLGLIVANQIP